MTNADTLKTSYIEGETVQLPAAERQGYLFGGWYTDEQFAGEAVTAIAEGTKGDLVFYAKWEPLKDIAYTVEYYRMDDNGFYGSDPVVTVNKTGTTDEEAVYDEEEDLKAYREENDITHFVIDKEKTGKTNIAGDGTTVVKVYISKMKFTLTWDYGTGKAAGDIYWGTATVMLRVADREGYTFEGWEAADEVTREIAPELPVVMPMSDLTYRAVYHAVSYAITYQNIEDVMNADELVKTYTAEEAVLLAEPVREGYVFDGWYADEALTEKVTAVAKQSAGDRIFYAKWLAGDEKTAEEQKAAAQAAQNAVTKIQAIGDVKYPDTKQPLNAARAAYYAVTEEQKTLLNETAAKALEDAAKVLADAEQEYKKQQESVLQVEETEKAILAIGETALTSKNKEEIVAVKKACDALTEEQKALISDEAKKLFGNIEAAYLIIQEEQAVIDAVAEKIQAIGTVTLDDKTKLDEAQKAYDALTESQKLLISEELQKVLTDANAAYTKLESDQKAAEEEELNKISVATVQKTILAASTDSKDVTGSEFHTIFPKAVGKKNAVKLTWQPVYGAAGYVVYGAVRGSSLVKLKYTTKLTYKHTKLTNNKYYKYVIVAYAKTGDTKTVLGISKTIYATPSGSTKGNPSSVTVLNSSNKAITSVSVSKGGTVTVKGSQKVTKKVTKCPSKAFRFESSDQRIATVNTKGVITGVAKGTCDLYVIAQNGVYKRIRVTVK